MKKPKFLNKLSAVLTPRLKKRLQASARAARPAVDDYDNDEPTTKLSSAFIVVLILHVVAVGGIYAFNSIKAARRDRDVGMSEVAPAMAVSAKAVTSNVVSAVAPNHTVEALTPTPAAVSKAPMGQQYEVQAGDNLTRIAFAYKVTPGDLMEANQLKEGSVLRPGQILVIPAVKLAAKPAVPASKTTPATKSGSGFYTVRKGDTLTSISRSLGVTVDALSKANKAVDPKKLQLGQSLKVPPRKN